MNLFSSLSRYRENYFSILLALLPFSYIAGNMIININIILIILSAILIFRKNLFQLKFFIIDKLILSFFTLIIISGIINDYYFYTEKLEWLGYFSTTLKSILFLKYLFLYLCLRFLFENDFLNLKFFFIGCLISSLFVCFDLLYQLYFGKDIFGFPKPGVGRKLGGPFGDELIAGSFIQRFSIFSFFLIPIFYKKELNKYLKYVISFLFLIFFIGITISGNRMPLILFLFTICLVILFQKETRKYLLSFVISFSLIFIVIITLSKDIRDNFGVFRVEITNIIKSIGKNGVSENSPHYLKEFASFYETWKINKYLGGGIKNFRYYCHVRENIPKDSKFICNMHPHNYYLEILTETGLVGLLISGTLFFLILYTTLVKKYFLRSPLNNNNMIIPFIFLFVAEIFPLKSTGSFFTTGNATYLFLIIGILLALTRKEISIENKK
tara:strand:+ start:1050 stop:2369 length:1320 start_codon:yes stop_codon:yes gene_type:complete